ncbi:MAG: hypothetical protein WCI55_04365 [Armatimonadota bacterium]
MKHLAPTSIVALLTLAVCAETHALVVQKQKKTTPKSAPQKGSGAIVMGTHQLPGEFGAFGKEYTIGTGLLLNFNLVSAEYRADRFVGENSVGETFSWVPLKNQKILILRYTVQNPNPKDTRLWYMSFKFTVVSADDQNSEQVNHPWIGNNTKYQEMLLKPAQKVTLTAAILVPSQGEVPKLIVQNGFDDKAAVVRFDLRGKVKRMADPAWSLNGIDTLDTLDAKLDTYYPWGGSDIQVNGIEELGATYGDLRAEMGQKLVAIKLKARGITPVPSRLWYGEFGAKIKTSDGETTEVRPYNNLLRGGRPEVFDGVVPVGDEQSLRLVASIPSTASIESLKLTFKNYEDIRRTYSFKL